MKNKQTTENFIIAAVLAILILAALWFSDVRIIFKGAIGIQIRQENTSTPETNR